MLASVIAFDNKVAEEIMTARTEVFMLKAEAPLKDSLAKMLETKHSRIPVYEDVIDNIIGVLYLKDLILEAYRVGFESIDIRQIMRPAYFVPEHKNITELFLELQNSRNHFAILIDEYGGFSGIVTMEDLMEEVMGDVDDKYERDETDIEKIDDHIFIAKGSISIKELNSVLDSKFDENSNYYDTLAGLLIYRLGYIPKDGYKKKLDYLGIRFFIKEIEKRKIKKVEITIVKNNHKFSPQKGQNDITY